MRDLRRGGTALALLAAAGMLVGCGGGDDDSPATTGTAAETTTESDPPPPEGPGGRIEVGDGDGGVALQEIGSFDEPVYVAQPDSDTDHLYVVERCGRVLRLPYDGGEETTFLDIGEQVTCDGSEQGLLSVAFHPGFESNGRFYVYFTDTAGDARVVEYQSTFEEPRAALPESGRELLRVEDFAANHNGGQLQFGPDRMLYIGTGDGGGAGDPERTAQDLDSPLGKVLRMDPRRGEDPEVVAYGLRNPWRFSFDRASDDLWIGDVGQDSLEEIDAASAAQVAALRPDINFGWSAFEGTERFNEDQEAPGARPPVLEYPLEESNCAVTGGYVVRDPSLPTLFGRYLYGDYCAGELRSFVPSDPVSGEATDDRELGVTVPQLSSFGEDAFGHVYAVSLEGPVHRLVAK